MHGLSEGIVQKLLSPVPDELVVDDGFDVDEVTEPPVAPGRVAAQY